VDGYEVVKADKKEVYRDAFFSMKLVEAYRSPVLHGYVEERGGSGVLLLLFGRHVCEIGLNRRSGKRGVMVVSVTFGFSTNKIVPDDFDYLHTQQRTQDYLELT
jgi:hypothetical protein